jgi:hypothetical protein
MLGLGAKYQTAGLKISKVRAEYRSLSINKKLFHNFFELKNAVTKIQT